MPEERVKDRIKYAGAYYEGLSPGLKGFYDDYYSLTGKYLQITSGRRKASSKIGKSSKISKHNTGDAIDISATHSDDYRFLMNSKEGLDLLAKYGLGIIDETDPDELEKTGGTGAHFHIGKDSFYAKQTKDRYNKILQGETIDEIIAYKDRVNNTTQTTTSVEARVELPNKAIQEYQYVPLDVRVAEKEIIKETKMNDDRKELVEAQNEYQTKVNFLNEYRNHLQTTADKSMQMINENTQPIDQYNVFENVQLQGYDPNRFVYNQNIEQR